MDWKGHERILKVGEKDASEVDTCKGLEGRRIRITQICACVLLYFLLKVAAFDVPS